MACARIVDSKAIAQHSPRRWQLDASPSLAPPCVLVQKELQLQWKKRLDEQRSSVLLYVKYDSYAAGIRALAVAMHMLARVASVQVRIYTGKCRFGQQWRATASSKTADIILTVTKPEFESNIFDARS